MEDLLEKKIARNSIICETNVSIPANNKFGNWNIFAASMGTEVTRFFKNVKYDLKRYKTLGGPYSIIFGLIVLKGSGLI